MSYTTVLNVAVIFSAAWQGTFCLPLSGRLQLSSNPVRAGGSLWAHCAVEMCPNNCLNHDFYIRLDGLRLQPSQSPATTTAELTSSNTTTNYVTTTATINTNGSTRISSRGTTTTTTPDGRAAVSGRECHVLSANVTVGSVKPPQGLVQCVVHCDLQGSVVVDEATVRVGYIPDAPSQPRCEVRGGEMGALSCSWKLGHDSLLKTDSQLCYQEVGKDKIKMCERVEGAQTVDLPGSKLDFHRHWELWVEVHNALGQSRSPPFSLMPNDFVTIEPPALQIVKYTHIADHISVKWTAQTGISIEYKCDLRLAYGNEEAWRTVFNRSLRSQIWDIHGLAPDTAYCVRIRCSQPVAKAPKGTWGQRKCFSTPPAQPLVGPEVWKILSPGPSDEVFNLTLLWKPLSAKEARGPVTSYHVMDRVNGETQAKVVQHGLESQPLYSLQLGKVQVPSEWCVQANNLAGSSPCSWLRLSARVLPAPFNVEAHEDKGSGGGGMAVRWAPPKPRGHERRRAVEGYVVEWVVADDDQTTPSMHWHCVPANTTHVVLSEHMKPLICYNISVVAIYETGEGKSGVVQAYAQQGVPNVGPKVSVANIALSSVDVNWTEIPTKERRGFITGHVIYWGQGPDASHRVLIRGSACAYTLKNLSASVEYSVMVAAMTEVGEGPPGAKTHFRMQGVLGCKGGPVEQDSLCSNATHENEYPENDNLGLKVTAGMSLVAITLIFFAIYQLPCIRKTFWPPVPDPGKSLLWKWMKESKVKDWEAVFPHVKKSYAPHSDEVALCKLDDEPGQSSSGPEANDAHFSYFQLNSATPEERFSCERYVNTRTVLTPVTCKGEHPRYQNTPPLPVFFLTPVPPSKGIGDNGGEAPQYAASPCSTRVPVQAACSSLS
ncbi:interleukin-31 receptor subunit alpha-like isoform X5 [Petromyzon marinus]|uniref:interleukin-31 receptor subunit alpha-like isoform X5 n=1 Tax=Petromyzon marinus TaxID=7757 RepID=UPI003F6EC703